MRPPPTGTTLTALAAAAPADLGGPGRIWAILSSRSHGEKPCIALSARTRVLAFTIRSTHDDWTPIATSG